MIQILNMPEDTRTDLIYEHDDQGFLVNYDGKTFRSAHAEPTRAMEEIEQAIATAYPDMVHPSYRISPSVSFYYHSMGWK